MKQIEEVIAEMADYLDQEYEPPLDTLANWIFRLENALGDIE